jgi:hypothetical protein
MGRTVPPVRMPAVAPALPPTLPRAVRPPVLSPAPLGGPGGLGGLPGSLVGAPVPQGAPSFGEIMRSGGAATAPAEPQGSRPRTTAPGERRHPDPLDPMTRHAAQLGPPLPEPLPGDAPAARAQAPARASLEDLLPALVRRVAWSGDAQRGTLRLELGAGALAGGTLVVEVERGRVRVNLRTPPGSDVAGWRRRIARRLRLELDAVEVE